MQRVVLALASLLAVLASLVSEAAAGEDRYRDEIERWRQKRLADLKAEDGWLTVSGLFWLKPGETTIGSDPSNDVLLPARAARLGRHAQARRRQGRTFGLHPACPFIRNGKPFEGGAIHSDADEHPDTLAVGRREVDPDQAGHAIRTAA